MQFQFVVLEGQRQSNRIGSEKDRDQQSVAWTWANLSLQISIGLSIELADFSLPNVALGLVAAPWILLEKPPIRCRFPAIGGIVPVGHQGQPFGRILGVLAFARAEDGRTRQGSSPCFGGPSGPNVNADDDQNFT
ncbi:hypothetical protein QO231_11770 [Sedimentitalea todarodis]|uniref:Uncharacterized protein n=1 Tax=Sedimentitalea todarodis TaxID=1631240 RepID=A0ABU3VEE6_9RHOB|nr:hypothetical protein [Sedimentitalea todarodis]